MFFEYLNTKLYARKDYRITAHVLFWVCCIILNWYSASISFNTYNNFGSWFLWQLATVNTLNIMLVYYPLVYWIVPFLKAKKYVPGIVGSAFLVIIYGVWSVLAEDALLKKCAYCMAALKIENNGYYNFLRMYWLNRLFAKVASMGSLIGLIFSLGVPVAIKIALTSFRQQLATVKLAKENVELEFNFLKSQVNPHFLFNSLNNIYGLIIKKQNNIAAETVARLAEFMRYTLHSPETDRMPIQKELQLLRDYVELEKIRLNYTTVNFDMQAGNTQCFLPSLLLVPLIENAFKFSADRYGATIDIRLVIDNSRLYLNVSNSVDADRQLNTTSGIGLQNLKKRLELYYPAKYSYTTTDNGHIYTTKLEINL